MSTQKRTPYFFLVLLIVSIVALYVFGERWLRHLLLYLSGAGWARDLVTRLPLAWRVASRFVAGETIDDGLRVAQELNQKGLGVAMDYLGESVTSEAEAVDARDHIIELIDCLAMTETDAYVSVKLTQLGLKLDERIALENLSTILTRAQKHGLRVRIDMEDSPVIDATFRIYHKLRFERGFDNVGVVVQSYLYRTEADVEQLIDEGAWVRLVKGAYMEPPDVAYPDKADTDANFVHLMQMMLGEEAQTNGVHLAVATHDEDMIQATTAYAREHKVDTRFYEFQMLYGIQRELQESLAAEGHDVRVYVPYGTAWYPYFVRRLAERPANLWFFISNLIRG